MASSLGVAVWLFVLAGAIHLLIGALTPISIRQNWSPGVLIYSPQADKAVFNETGEELRAQPNLTKLREITLGMISGLLVGVGLLEMAIAWFALRQGEAWALAVLVGAQLAMVAFWVVGHRLWLGAGMPGGLFALQPYQYVPFILMVPAAILGFRAVAGHTTP